MKLRKLLEGLDFPPQPETLELVVSGVCYEIGRASCRERV